MNIIFIGATASGKTTLIQRLNHEELKYNKTQVIKYISSFIDTPGEYVQVRAFWTSLTVASHDADLICLVQDSTNRDCWFSGGIRSKFSKPVIGVATKIDSPNSDISLASRYLEYAGCDQVFSVSALTNAGIDGLREGIQTAISDFKEKVKEHSRPGYYD